MSIQTLIPSSLNDEQIKEIKESFDLFDIDGTGKIDPVELCISLKTLGYENARPEIKKIIAQLQKLPQAPIDFPTFLKLVNTTMLERDPIEEINKAFQRFDDDSTDRISFRNLKRVALELGEQLTDDEIKEMLKAADKDHDGEIGHNEFIDLIQNENVF